MNFSLCANYAGFCSDSHIYTRDKGCKHTMFIVLQLYNNYIVLIRQTISDSGSDRGLLRQLLVFLLVLCYYRIIKLYILDVNSLHKFSLKSLVMSKPSCRVLLSS